MEESEIEIKSIEIGEEFSTCPACGYKRGFHSMFKKTKENCPLDWYLICPQCGARYDIGLTCFKG